ncbi:hypothetical protein [Virgibacillus sp. DJP39]|uniref:hypothetical protein n=1 Tax=Virgibacillus sp. DJP39 TaxID=3409790 RepID=UPI003BB54C55
MENLYLLSVITIALTLVFQSVFLIKLTKKIENFESNAPVGSESANKNENGPKINSILPIVKHKDIFDNPIKIGGESNVESLLFFVSPSCEGCFQFLSEIKKMQNTTNINYTFIVKVQSSEEVLIQPDFNATKDMFTFVALEPLFELYNIRSYPFFIAIDKDGKVLEKGVIKGLKEFEKYGFKQAV